MDAHAHMGALVLLRAVIEAMLVGALLTIEDDARIDFAKRFPGQRREAADAIPTWSIVQLLQVATDNGLISAATSSLCREINRSRNDIHLFSCACLFLRTCLPFGSLFGSRDSTITQRSAEKRLGNCWSRQLSFIFRSKVGRSPGSLRVAESAPRLNSSLGCS